MKSLQQKLMESLIEDVPAQIEQPKQLSAGDDVLVDWDGEQVTAIVVSVADDVVKVNRVIDGETVDRDYTLSQIQSLEEPVEVVTDITESVALTALVQQWDDTYGENFAKEYPEAFKKMKAKNSKTLTDIEAVWLDVYGEQFKDEYQGIYTALSKTLNEDCDEVDENITESLESEQFINRIKALDAKFELYHHNTGSFAKHKTFDDIYAEFDALEDDLIEKIMGYTGEKYAGVNIELVYSDSTGQELVNDLMNLGADLQEFAKANAYNDIEQYGQTIHGLGAKLNYLLTFNENLNEASQDSKLNHLKDVSFTDLVFPRGDANLRTYQSIIKKQILFDFNNKAVEQFLKEARWIQFSEDDDTLSAKDAGLEIRRQFEKWFKGMEHLYESAQTISEAVVNDKESFKEYAETVMKQAHGDDYDQAIVDKMVDDIAAEVGDDWGAAVGQLTSGLGEELKALPDATSNGDGIAMRTESKDLAPKEYDALSDKDKKRYVYNKETDTWMFDSTLSEAADAEDDEEAKSKEYDAGFAAGEDDTVNEEDCPYEEGTDEAKDWCEGYKAGSKK